MSDAPPVRDENLRLVLSAQEDRYIRGRIHEYRRMLRAMAIVLAIGVAWLALDAVNYFVPGVTAECMTIIRAPGDTRTPAEIARSYGATACPPEVANRPWTEGPTWRDIRGMARALALVLVFYGGFGLIRYGFLSRRYAGYLKDHKAFLEKYGRTQT